MYDIAICIATYKRLIMLDKLLESLSKLAFNKNPKVKSCIIVIDNDNKGSAYSVVDKYSSEFSKILYDIEPTRGISSARNKAVDIAKKFNCHYIAFVDDDEIVDPFWLDELLFTIREYQADIVVGPVFFIFPRDTPEWIIKGNFFPRPLYQTGEQIYMGATNNVLFTRESLDKLKGPFDERFNISGGSDTYLFKSLSGGAKIVWTNEAIVKENVPLSRANAKWILKRAFRGGNTIGLCDKYLARNILTIFIRLLKGAFRITQGFITFLPSLFIGKQRIIRSIHYIFLGAGMIAGIMGYKFEEYRVIHGS
ncbi:MAG: hypothetical protein JM58_14335 [Peptococcaceae bacterium BICA1-8]|nr:MAG: hypothetical protein JM58_14335 [Peptococcaceae bacterium BICA1-8]